MISKEHTSQIRDAVAELSETDALNTMCHMRFHGEPLPSEVILHEIIDICRALIFPGFFGQSNITKDTINYYIGVNADRLFELLSGQIMAGLCFKYKSDEAIDWQQLKKTADSKATTFISKLPELRKILNTDVKATYLGDPAAESIEEVIYCYPGLRAICNYRLAHALLVDGIPVIPRIISEMAHSETGIDIHPGAQIGEYFSIDHGTGVVIGATAIIGKNVKLYQGVTLGAKSFTLDDENNPVKGIPRHPIIGDNVIIYSNTSVLGRLHIGDNAVIGGNIWVTDDVEDGEKLLQAKANNILRFKQ